MILFKKAFLYALVSLWVATALSPSTSLAAEEGGGYDLERIEELYQEELRQLTEALVGVNTPGEDLMAHYRATVAAGNAAWRAAGAAAVEAAGDAAVEAAERPAWVAAERAARVAAGKAAERPAWVAAERAAGAAAVEAAGDAAVEAAERPAWVAAERAARVAAERAARVAAGKAAWRAAVEAAGDAAMDAQGAGGTPELIGKAAATGAFAGLRGVLAVEWPRIHGAALASLEGEGVFTHRWNEGWEKPEGDGIGTIPENWQGLLPFLNGIMEAHLAAAQVAGNQAEIEYAERMLEMIRERLRLESEGAMTKAAR